MSRGRGKLRPSDQYVIVIQAIGNFAGRAIRVVNEYDCFANLQGMPIAFHLVSLFALGCMINLIGPGYDVCSSKFALLAAAS